MNQLQSTKQINALKLQAIKKGGFHTMKDVILLDCDYHFKNFGVDLTPKQLIETPDFITETLELIKEQTGLTLKLCDYFTGIKEHNGKKYFNVILQQRISESEEYQVLKRFADKYKVISVESNGLNRVSIFKNKIKSKECSKVLQLMDEDFTYCKALKIVLESNPELNKEELENELNNYI